MAFGANILAVNVNKFAADAVNMEPQIAHAQDTAKTNGILSIPKPETLPGPSEKTQTEEKGGKWGVTVLLPKITQMLTAFAAVGCFIFLIISGIRFMTAYGNTEAATNARKQVQYALIGLLVSIFAYAIVSIVTSISF